MLVIQTSHGVRGSDGKMCVLSRRNKENCQNGNLQGEIQRNMSLTKKEIFIGAKKSLLSLIFNRTSVGDLQL